MSDGGTNFRSLAPNSCLDQPEARRAWHNGHADLFSAAPALRRNEIAVGASTSCARSRPPCQRTGAQMGIANGWDAGARRGDALGGLLLSLTSANADRVSPSLARRGVSGDPVQPRAGSSALRWRYHSRIYSVASRWCRIRSKTASPLWSQAIASRSMRSGTASPSARAGAAASALI